MKIALLGDIAFFGKNDVTKNKSIYHYYKDVAAFLSNYDYVIGNLETPFITNQKTFGAKSAYIKSHPNNVELLKYLNVGVVNLANNHIFDFGKKGFELTKKILNQNNIKYFGVDDKQIYLKDKNTKIALHGYCGYSTNPLGLKGKNNYGINTLNIKDVEKNLLKNFKDGYYNISSFHIGLEHINYPSYDHIKMAHQFSEICPYTFYGHHPHVAQGIEEFNNSLIAYSLGNFCFDDVYTDKSEKPLIKQTDNNKTSFILDLEIVDNKLINYKIIPIFAGNNKMDLNPTETLDKISQYSNKLSVNEEDYKKYRTLLLNKYINSRKEMRDFNWFKKRLNINSFFMLKNAYFNKKKYNKNIKSLLKE